MGAETGLDIRPAADPREAVAAADLIVSAIPPPDAPFVEPSWLKPGALAVALDYFHCYRPKAVMGMAAVMADDTGRIAPHVARMAAGGTAPPIVDFAPIVAGRARFEPVADRPVLAIPTGIASTDVTLAVEIVARARAAGLGTGLALTTS